MLRRTMMLVPVCGLLAALQVHADEAADSAYTRSGWYAGAGFGVSLGQFEKEYEKPRYLTTSGEGILSRKALNPPSSEGDKFRIEPPFDEAFGTPDLVEINVDDRFSFNLHGGYRIGPRWAVEAQMEVTDDFEVIVTEDIPFKNARLETPDPSNPGQLLPTRTFIRESNANLVIRPIVLTTNLKGYVLTGRFQPYLLIGTGVAWTDTENRPKGESVTHVDFTMRFGGGVEYYITDHLLISSSVSYVYPMGFMKDKADYVSVEAMAFHYRFGSVD